MKEQRDKITWRNGYVFVRTKGGLYRFNPLTQVYETLMKLVKRKPDNS